MDKIFKYFSPSPPVTPGKSFYKISGKATFKVNVTITGNQPHSNCALSVISLQNNPNNLVIGSKCEWFRCYFDQEIPIKGDGNTYRVSALDIGSKIKAKITPTEPDETGTAFVVFGPIIMDPQQKQVLKNIIKSGGAKYEFESISPFDVDEGIHAGSLVVFQNHIKINLGGAAEKKDFRIFFGEHFEIHTGKDDRTLVLRFFDMIKSNEIRDLFGLGPTQQPNTLKIKLISQLSKDNLIITIRTFEEMIELKDSLIIEKAIGISNADLKEIRELKIEDDDISTQLDNTNLNRELDLLNEVHYQGKQEVERLNNIINNLDGEISRTQYCRNN